MYEAIKLTAVATSGMSGGVRTSRHLLACQPLQCVWHDILICLMAAFSCTVALQQQVQLVLSVLLLHPGKLLCMQNALKIHKQQGQCTTVML